MAEDKCTQCGKCCKRSPCSIPVMHIDALRVILVREFGKPEQVNGLDIVNVLFRYEEETLPTGQISGYFMPLPGGKWKEVCMWLEKKEGKYFCKLFWNKTAEHLVGFPEQVAGKGKGCSYGGKKRVPIIPMVYRDGIRAIASILLQKTK